MRPVTWDFLAGLRPRAVLGGWAADWSLSFLFFALMTAVVAGGGGTPEEITARMTESLDLQIASLVAGLAFTGVGGYVAAALARERHVPHGVAVGVVSLTVGVLLSLLGGAFGVAQLVGYALTVPVAAFGGWYRKTTERPAP